MRGQVRIPPRGCSYCSTTAAFLTMLSGLMLGPLLVPLAHQLQTSVAIVGRSVRHHLHRLGDRRPTGGSGLQLLPDGGC